MEKQNTDSLAVFNQLYKEMDEIYHQYAKQHGVSDAALWLMYSLYENQSSYTQSALCSDWHYPPQTINSTLKKLEKRGLIALQAGTENQKNKYITLTAQGRATIQAIIGPLVHAEQETFYKLGKQEGNALLALTRKYVSLLQAQVHQADTAPKISTE